MGVSPRDTTSGRRQAWLRVARLPTLSAAVVPVMVGTATAARASTIQPLTALAALLAALLLQTGANLANDYFDFQKGADTSTRLGPIRVGPSHGVTPGAARNAALASLGLALLPGMYLVTIGGLPILAVGVLAAGVAILYTGGPWPLGYHGLGDLCVFVFFGLVGVVGSAYLQTGAVLGAALLDALPVGLLVTAILVVNNLRDLETDRAAGKRTLAVRIGRRATRIEYALLLGTAYLVPLERGLAGSASAGAWLPWLTLPLAMRLTWRVIRAEGPPLNQALRATAQLHLLFGILFAASLLA